MTDALLYLPGERVRITGVYEVLHFGHRAPHDAFLCEEERFPPCQQCGERVIFRLLRPTTNCIGEHIGGDKDFTNVRAKR